MLAVDCGLLSSGCGTLALLALAGTFKAFDLACLGGAFSLIGPPFAHIGSLLTPVGLLISFLSEPLARIRRSLTIPHVLLARVQLCFAQLELILRGLDVGLPILRAHTRRGPVVALSDDLVRAGASDQFGPAAFECRPGALMRGRVTMKSRPRVGALVRPECRGLLVPDGRLLMARFRLLVPMQ